MPPVLVEFLSDQDAAKATRTMEAMMNLGKLDIDALSPAHAGHG